MTNKKRTCGMDDYCYHCQSKAKMHPMERNALAVKAEGGGRAFPLYCGPGDTANTGGMTLRDYFAAAALHGLIVSTSYETTRDCANDAYRIADAMLAERAKQ